MRWSFFLVFLLVLFSSCNDNKTEQYHLSTGLLEYSKKRIVNETFVEGYSIESIAFFKNGDENKRLILKLNNDISEAFVEKYTMGIHAYSKELPKDNLKGFLIWDNKPYLEKTKNNSYISVDIKTRISVFDSINFFLYNREEYKGVESYLIRLKNVKFN